MTWTGQGDGWHLALCYLKMGVLPGNCFSVTVGMCSASVQQETTIDDIVIAAAASSLRSGLGATATVTSTALHLVLRVNAVEVFIRRSFWWLLVFLWYQQDGVECISNVLIK